MTQDTSCTFAEYFSTSTSNLSIKEVDDEERRLIENPLEKCQIATNEVLRLKDQKVSVITVEKCVRNWCDAFLILNEEGNEAQLLQFYDLLARLAGVKAAKLKESCRKYVELNDPDSSSQRTEDEMRESLNPDYLWIFSKVGQIEGGVKFLVDFRASLIKASKANSNLQISAR